MFRKWSFLLLAVVANISVAGAMNTPDEKRATERATSLIEHGRYGEARHELMRLRNSISIDNEPLVRYIDFSLVRCAAELGDNDAEKIMLAFLRRYPESVHVNDVRFMLAMYYCEREEYANARKYFDIVSYKALSAEELAEIKKLMDTFEGSSV